MSSAEEPPSDDTIKWGTISALSVSVAGISFLDDPVAFIQVVVLKRIVDTSTGIAGEIALQLLNIWTILTDTVLGGFATAIVTPFEVGGDLILTLVGVIDGIANSVASSAGPFGIVIIPGIWAVTIILLGGLLIGIWRAYLWIRTVVV